MNDPRPPTYSATHATAPQARSSLFWRLLPSYLLVIAVGAATTFVAGESFAPFFLDRHVNSMMLTIHNHATEGMTQGMIVDLNAAYRRALTGSLSWAALVSIIAAALVGLFVTRRIVTPLRAMTRASRRIAGGSYQARLDTGVPGEIGDLATAFNTMAATLERSEEQRVALLADVSHEFRTPLSNLKGYVEGLEDGVFVLDDATLGACLRQLGRLERLVDDLSLLSRVETGQLELKPVRIDVGELLEQSREAFGARFKQKDIQLILDMPAAPLTVTADPERTTQVLANLVGNALRHTPTGGSVALQVVREGVTAVRFEIEDSGTGIAPEDLPHVFKRFYRGDKARRREEGDGSGIGLTLVKQLVERQGGRVGVENRPQGGARFWFTLPTVAPAGDADSPLSSESSP